MIEWNVVVATFYFSAAIVADALSAHDLGAEAVDAPSSLRASAVLLLLCIAAPPLVNKELGIDGTMQYLLLGVCLPVVAILGLHEGSAATRSADGFFVGALFVPSVVAVVNGGTDMKDLRAHNVRLAKARVAASALAASALFYGSARTLRLSLMHASSTRTFQVSSAIAIRNSTEFSTLGYGLCSLPSTVASSFGAAVGMGAAMVVIGSRWADEQDSESDHSLLMGISGIVTLTSAFCLHLSLHEHIDTLPALYGAGACDSTKEACGAAFAARRFAIANTPVPQLLLTALGMFAFGYPKSRRLSSARPEFRWSLESTWTAFVCGVVVVIVCTETLSFSGDQWYVDVLGCAMLLGTALMMWDTSIGAIVYLVAAVCFEVLEIDAWGLSEVGKYIGHVMLWIHLALLFVHWTLTFFVDLFGRSETLSAVLGVVASMGMSLSLFLCVSALGLMAAVNGGGVLNLTSRPEGGIRAVFSFFFEHILPVIVWGFLYACRCEVGILNEVVGARTRQVVWISSVVLAVVINGGVQNWVAHSGELNVQEVGNDFTAYVDGWPLASSATGIVMLPWLAAALV